MPRSPLLVALAAITIVPAGVASAPCEATARCVCSYVLRSATLAERTAEQRERATAVLVGRVVAIETEIATGGRSWRDTGDSTQVRRWEVARIAAQRWWKGDVADTVTVVLRPDVRYGSSCDLKLVVDSTYLILAHGRPGQLAVAHCGGTRPLSTADSVLPLLGATLPRRP